MVGRPRVLRFGFPRPEGGGFVWGFGRSRPRDPRLALFGEVFTRPLKPPTRPRPPGRCDRVRLGNSRRDFLPAQIAIGFVLENCVIASGGRRACPKADKRSSACVLSKSIAGDTASLCSRVAPCLVHNASRRNADGLSPCHESRPLFRYDRERFGLRPSKIIGRVERRGSKGLGGRASSGSQPGKALRLP